MCGVQGVRVCELSENVQWPVAAYVQWSLQWSTSWPYK